jgi:hypothetical protein
MIRKVLFSSPSRAGIVSSISSAMFKICFAVMLLASTCAFAITVDQKPSPGLCGLTEEDSAGLSRNLSVDVYAVREYIDRSRSKKCIEGC